MIIRDYNWYEGYLSHRFTTQALVVIHQQELWSRTFKYRFFYSFYLISGKVQNTNRNKIQKSQLKTKALCFTSVTLGSSVFVFCLFVVFLK